MKQSEWTNALFAFYLIADALMNISKTNGNNEYEEDEKDTCV
jgi:hypothetical protein